MNDYNIRKATYVPIEAGQSKLLLYMTFEPNALTPITMHA